MAKKNNITPKGRAGDVPVYCAHDAVVSLDELTPNPQNPNKHGTDQVQRLATILRKAGWRAPITVSTRSGFIVKGHGRLMAAQVAGFTHAPVDYQDYATEADELADLMADNYIAELSETDTEMAAAILACINDSDTPLELSGYTEDEFADLNAILQSAIDDILEDDVPDEPEEPVTKRGDLWILGQHKLLCGDSTTGDVLVLMDDEQADLMVTDPPYNIAYTGKTKDALKIQNDEMDEQRFREFLEKALTRANEILRRGGMVYLAHSRQGGHRVPSNVRKNRDARQADACVE